MNEALEALCRSGQDFYDRGYAFGSTGNLSVREGDRVWITPTGRPLKELAPEHLACVSLTGQVQGAVRPSKEYPFHVGIYRRRADVHAIVHLHSTYAFALSCLEDLDAPLPAISPYYFMRVAPVAVVPYFPPGSDELAQAVEEAASANCLLLRNHGLIALGGSWNEAVDRAEEFEQTARLRFLLRGERLRELSAAEVDELARRFR